MKSSLTKKKAAPKEDCNFEISVQLMLLDLFVHLNVLL